MGQLGTVPKWGNVGAILIARQNGAKKEGADAPSNESFSEDTHMGENKCWLADKDGCIPRIETDVDICEQCIAFNTFHYLPASFRILTNPILKWGSL